MKSDISDQSYQNNHGDKIEQIDLINKIDERRYQMDQSSCQIEQVTKVTYETQIMELNTNIKVTKIINCVTKENKVTNLPIKKK